jgi:hypothetical protein
MKQNKVIDIFNKVLKELCENYNEFYKEKLNISVKRKKQIVDFYNNVNQVKEKFGNRDVECLKSIKLLKSFVDKKIDDNTWVYFDNLYHISYTLVVGPVKLNKDEIKNIDTENLSNVMGDLIGQFGIENLDKNKLSGSITTIVNKLQTDDELLTKLSKHLDTTDIQQSLNNILQDEENKKLFLDLAQECGIDKIV